MADTQVLGFLLLVCLFCDRTAARGDAKEERWTLDTTDFRSVRLFRTSAS